MIGVVIVVGFIVLALWGMGQAIRERDWRTALMLAGMALFLFGVAVGLGALIANTEAQR